MLRVQIGIKTGTDDRPRSRLFRVGKSRLGDQHTGAGAGFEHQILVRRDRGQCPAEDPPGVLRAHVDAAVAVRVAEVVVPVGAMQGHAVVGDVGVPGSAGQVEEGGLVGAAEHVIGGAFVEGAEPAGGRLIVLLAGGNTRGVDRYFPPRRRAGAAGPG